MKNLDSKTKQFILEYLISRKGETISGDVLCKYSGLKNKATLRQYINDLRIDGEPILSFWNGYKYSTDWSEVYKCVQELKGRAQSILNAAEGMMDRINNQ